MTTIQNDITASDRNINNTVNINISEGNSSFWQKRKKCIIITSISSIVVITLLVILIAILTKDKNKTQETPQSPNEKFAERNYISTTMKEGFEINQDTNLQIVGENYEQKNDILIIGKSGKKFNITEKGQIKNITNDDLPLKYYFNDNIINSSYLFKDVNCFKAIDLSKMNSSKLVDATNMFENSDFEEIYFATENSNNSETRNLQESSEQRKGYFDTSEIQNVSNMFNNCTNLKKIEFPPSFNVGKNATGMFKGCTKLEEVNTSSIISTEIEEMDSMFEDCSSLKEISFSNDFLTGEVKSLNNTFKNTNLSTLDISYLRLYNLENTSNIFTGSTINGVLKIGKHFSNDSLRDNFFTEIAKVTDSKTTVFTPRETEINKVFQNIYFTQNNVNILATPIDIDYNINYKEDKNYIIYSNNLHFGLGWDFDETNTYDLDSSVVTFSKSINYLAEVNFQRLREYGGVINLNLDDLTGEGDGDDEEIRVTLNLLPSEVKYFTVQINSYRGNSLKYVKSAYIRLSSGSEVIGTYSINQAGNSVGLLIGCFFKNNGKATGWSFKPLNKAIPGQVVTESVNTIQRILLDLFDEETGYDMIQKLVNSAKYKNKKSTLSIIGNLLFDYEYEPSFVAGVLANIYHEGNIGKFESSAYSSNRKPQYLEYMDTLYNYSTLYSNKLITEVSLYDLSNVLYQCQANNWEQGKFGLGCVQWTGERTYTLFQLYVLRCGYNDRITIEQATAAEGQMIINELKGSYSYIYNDWKNNNPDKDSDSSAYNAGYNIWVKYEVPSDKENKGITRGNTAKDMFNIMTS